MAWRIIGSMTSPSACSALRSAMPSICRGGTSMKIAVASAVTSPLTEMVATVWIFRPSIDTCRASRSRGHTWSAGDEVGIAKDFVEEQSHHATVQTRRGSLIGNREDGPSSNEAPVLVLGRPDRDRRRERVGPSGHRAIREEVSRVLGNIGGDPGAASWTSRLLKTVSNTTEDLSLGEEHLVGNVLGHEKVDQVPDGLSRLTPWQVWPLRHRAVERQSFGR